MKLKNLEKLIQYIKETYQSIPLEKNLFNCYPVGELIKDLRGIFLQLSKNRSIDENLLDWFGNCQESCRLK